MTPRTLNLEYLRPIFDDDPKVLADLVREVVEASGELIGKLERAAPERGEALSVAHELKGMCRVTGAEELGSLCAQVEDLIRDDRWPEASARFATLRQAHQRFSQAAAAIEA